MTAVTYMNWSLVRCRPYSRNLSCLNTSCNLTKNYCSKMQYTFQKIRLHTRGKSVVNCTQWVKNGQIVHQKLRLPQTRPQTQRLKSMFFKKISSLCKPLSDCSIRNCSKNTAASLNCIFFRILTRCSSNVILCIIEILF